MGRTPSNGGPVFRFNQTEVAEMETIMQKHHNELPTREIFVALAEKFSASAERSGKSEVQMKQVWNWFQNRRSAIRAKSAKSRGKLSVTPLRLTDSPTVSSVPQAPQSVTAPSVQSVGRTALDNEPMEFEAKSARDGAWYDVKRFLYHRSLETGDPDVLVRFADLGAEEDEWINVLRHVRQRSLPCEASECVAVLSGDLILCFQEGKEQALYFDAHVVDAQRRRHDVRGCCCRFLVRYDHDQSEEIVPLRKVCRRPETDYRLHQLHAKNDFTSNTLRVYPPPNEQAMPTKQQQEKAEETTDAAAVVAPPTSLGNVPVTMEAKVLQPKGAGVSTARGVRISVVLPPANAAVTSGTPANTLTSGSAPNMPQG